MPENENQKEHSIEQNNNEWQKFGMQRDGIQMDCVSRVRYKKRVLTALKKDYGNFKLSHHEPLYRYQFNSFDFHSFFIRCLNATHFEIIKQTNSMSQPKMTAAKWEAGSIFISKNARRNGQILWWAHYFHLYSVDVIRLFVNYSMVRSSWMCFVRTHACSDSNRFDVCSLTFWPWNGANCGFIE